MLYSAFTGRPLANSLFVSLRDSSSPFILSIARSLLYYINSIVALSDKPADPPYGLSFITVTYKLLPPKSLIAIAESTG